MAFCGGDVLTQLGHVLAPRGCTNADSDGPVVVCQDNNFVVLYQPGQRQENTSKSNEANAIDVPPTHKEWSSHRAGQRMPSEDRESSNIIAIAPDDDVYESGSRHEIISTRSKKGEASDSNSSKTSYKMEHTSKESPATRHKKDDRTLADLEIRNSSHQLSNHSHRSCKTNTTLEGSDAVGSLQIQTTGDISLPVYRIAQPERKQLTQRNGGTISDQPPCGHHVNHRMRQFLKELLRFKTLKIWQILLSIYIIVLTFAYIAPPVGLRDPKTGFIVDLTSAELTKAGLILNKGVERAIVADSRFQLVCFGISRFTAFFMYPGKQDTHLLGLVVLATLSHNITQYDLHSPSLRLHFQVPCNNNIHHQVATGHAYVLRFARAPCLLWLDDSHLRLDPFHSSSYQMGGPGKPVLACPSVLRNYRRDHHPQLPPDMYSYACISRKNQVRSAQGASLPVPPVCSGIDVSHAQVCCPEWRIHHIRLRHVARMVFCGRHVLLFLHD